MELLRKCVKFIMPNCCELIDPDHFKQTHIDLLRLPYPTIALEAPWEKEGEQPQQMGDFQQTTANKRIALCWEASPAHELVPGLNSILTAFPEGGIFLLPIYWTPEGKRWLVALGGAFLPYENELCKVAMDDALPASRIANQALIDAGQAKETALQFRAEPFALLPELFDMTMQRYGSREKAFAQIMLDTHDESMMLIQACSVLNCANVATAEIKPDAPLNKKRQAKGQQPFFSYKVLQLAEERRGGRGTAASGEHASPRMHLRRGHLRRLEHKTTWVRPTTVNAGSKLGEVAKDYALTPKNPGEHSGPPGPPDF